MHVRNPFSEVTQTASLLFYSLSPPSFGFYDFILEPAPHTHGCIHAVMFIMEIQASSLVLVSLKPWF